MTAAEDDMACQELVELVTGYLEDSLSASERMRFEAHIVNCSGCHAYLDQMRTTLRTLGTLSEETMSREARDWLLNMFRDWKAV